MINASNYHIGKTFQKIQYAPNYSFFLIFTRFKLFFSLLRQLRPLIILALKLALDAIWVLKNSSKTLFRLSCIPDLYFIRAKRIETFPLQV